MRLTARVPATSANLGPGFDCFGLALDLCNEFTVDTDAEPVITWEGEGAGELPTDGSDMVSRAMQRTDDDGALPPLAIHGRNRIPLARGLGSSSAAAVAGVVLAQRLLGMVAGPPDPYVAWGLAVDVEGHPDNAGACLNGGLTVSVGGVGARRLDPHPDLRPCLLIPTDIRRSTSEARRALPNQVSRTDAVFNIQRTALALIAFTTEPGLLRGALEDRLHQDVRLAAMPQVREVFERIRDAGVPVCVSGSGPTLIAFPLEGQEPPDPGDGWRVLHVPVRAEGVELVEG